MSRPARPHGSGRSDADEHRCGSFPPIADITDPLVGQRHNRVLSVHDLPATVSFEPRICPDELASSIAFLFPSLTTLRDCGVTEHAYMNIIRFVAEKWSGAGRPKSNCGLLLEYLT